MQVISLSSQSIHSYIRYYVALAVRQLKIGNVTAEDCVKPVNKYP